MKTQGADRHPQVHRATAPSFGLDVSVEANLHAPGPSVTRHQRASFNSGTPRASTPSACGRSRHSAPPAKMQVVVSTPAGSNSLSLPVTTTAHRAGAVAAVLRSSPLRPNQAVRATGCHPHGRPDDSKCALLAGTAGTGQNSQASGNVTFAVPELTRKTPSASPL